jgi:excisionase family DNA binding protein
MTTTQRYLTLSEAAEVARTNVSTIRWWIAERRLTSYKPGKIRLVREDQLLAFIESTADFATPHVE